MKAICPHCNTQKVITFKQTDSGEPIICPRCGKNMRQLGWDLKVARVLK